jgi:hypothetical protein
MEYDDLAEEISCLFEPEPDEDSTGREWPHERLTSYHKMNFDYMKTFNWEGSTTHPNTRLCPETEKGVNELTRNMDVPTRLFEAALRVYGDSLVTYYRSKEQTTALRYYPPVILTFWSAFEAFVRHNSELMVLTVGNLPGPIADYLRERTVTIDKKGATAEAPRFQPVLDRYVVLLRYGYSFTIDRGHKHWQALERARELRDYYTHIDALSSRSISAKQVLDFAEAVLLGIIWPSEQVHRTLLLGVHYLYGIWAELAELTESVLPGGHAEEPFFHSKNLSEQFLFYCPFENVDSKRFPNWKEQERQRNGKK